MKTDQLNLIEIIKDEWADIHHTRKQEWTSLAIIGGVFYALFKAENPTLQIAITIFGLVACILSIYMLFRHWLLFRSKIRIIDLLENELGVIYKFHEFKFKIPVQAIIVLFFFLLTSTLFGYLAWLLWINIYVSIIVSFCIFAFGVFLCCKMHKWIKNNVENNVQVKLIDKTGEERVLEKKEF